MNKNLVEAAFAKNSGPIPVWFMRQAGRYLPEYQGLRKTNDFRKMSHTPELICETTLQPMRRYPLNAAIMFSDILTCLEFMGAPFKFEETGPKLSDSGPHALTGLTPLIPEKHMSFVGNGIKLTVEELKAKHDAKPLIGFVGAPFTLASYLVEGGTSREFFATRQFMLKDPESFKNALGKLAESVGNYLVYQVKCGVSAVQIFDSWVGFVSREQYRDLIFPAVKKVIEIVKHSTQVPVILYSQPTLHLLPLMAQSGADVLSVDWRTPIGDVAALVDQHASKKIALQGNLDPIVTTLPWNQCQPHVRRVLESAAQAKILDRFIFNVGHGVSPETRTDTIEAIITEVHQFKGS